MRKKSDRFTVPAWHWALHLPMSRFVPKRFRTLVGAGTRRALPWQVTIPTGFSLSGRRSHSNCTRLERRYQLQRLGALTPSVARLPTTWCLLAYGFPPPFAVRVNLRKGGLVRYWLLLTDGVRPLAYAARTVDFQGKQVAHDYLAFVPSGQSQGHGAQILANALSVYSQMGITKITLTAGLSAGSAVWPRLGFMPVSVGEWAKLRLTISSNAVNLGNSIHSAYLQQYGRDLAPAISAIVSDTDPKAIFDIVDIDPGNKAGKAAKLLHGIAGALLSGGHWRGCLDINGSGGERLRTYLINRDVSFPAEME